MYYTYILHSISVNKFYIGASEKPSERLKKHNAKNKGFTNQSNDWEIVFLKPFETKTEALSFERQIKRWKSSVKIQQLINSSVGLEHLPYKQGVGGSNPSSPTLIKASFTRMMLFLFNRI